MTTLPTGRALKIGFAHAAYQLEAEFAGRGIPAEHFSMWSYDELRAGVAQVDVLCTSFLWKDELISLAPNLRFIQSVSAGTDQFGKDALRAAGIRLASGQGSNEIAVAEHAMSLMLALTRHLHLARDRQHEGIWRPMIARRSEREEQLSGKTLVIFGLGRIGLRLARLAGAFGMRTIGVRRRPGPEAGVDLVVPREQLLAVLPQADVLALTCPLTPETEGAIGAAELAALKPTARLINVARGRVAQEAPLLEALAAGRLAGAGLDCFQQEPLPPDSPFWRLPNVLVTPHSAGETQAYETGVVDLLVENIERLRAGSELRNQIV